MQLWREPHCPRCLVAIALRPLWRVATTSGGQFLGGNIGIVCPRCGAKLRVQQTRIVVALILTFVVFLAGTIYGVPALKAADLGMSDGALLFVLFALTCLLVFGPRYYIPNLATLRIIDPGESVRFPLTEREKLDTKEAAELAELVAQFERPGSEEQLNGADWVCSTCREANPRTFEVCWKCKSARPEQ